MNSKLKKFKRTKFNNLVRDLDFDSTDSVNSEIVNGNHEGRTKERISLDEYKKLLFKNKWTQKEFVDNGYSKHQISFYNWLLKGKCNLGKDDFIEEYVNNLNELDNISKKYNISRGHLTMLREYYGISRQGHKRRKRYKEQIPFSEKQKQLVLGSLLGDGKIEASRNVFAIRHSTKQYDYCKYKLEILKEHCSYNEPKILKNYDHRYDTFNDTCFFATLSHGYIESIYPTIYINGNKTVTKEWLDILDDFALSVWYMDDGNTYYSDYGSPCCRLHTESFSKYENNIIKEWFENKYNISPSIKNKDADNYYLYFNVEDSFKLIDIIKKYCIDNLKYKVDCNTNIKLRKENNKEGDFTKIPTKSKFKKMEENEQTSIVDQIYGYYRERGFPYYDFNVDQCRLMFSKLCNLNTNILIDEDIIKPNYRCLNLIQYYQPHIYGMAPKGCFSPVEIYDDDNMFKDAIYRRLKYVGTPTEAGIRSILKSYKNNRAVSNFPPSAAKAIYEDLLKDESSVFDFCAGFGGRMLGSMSSKVVKRYVGIDVLGKTCSGLNRMYEDLDNDNCSVKIINSQSELVIDNIDETFDIVFTSPPYFDNEIYSKDTDQSCNKYIGYDMWLTEWLMPLIRKSFNLINPNGFMVLSLGKTHNGIDITEDVKSLLSYDYNLHKIYKMQTGVNEYQRKNKTKKFMPILVYKK